MRGNFSLCHGDEVQELLKQGKRHAFFGVNRNSIHRWRCQAEQAPDGLAAKPHPHRPPALSDEQIGTLECLLAQGATAHGWHNFVDHRPRRHPYRGVIYPVVPQIGVKG
jgi:hypothetical protein